VVTAVNAMLGSELSGACPLSALATGQAATVAKVKTSPELTAVSRRLAEIGFLPGESLRILARIPGGDPIAVRIGGSTFALRRHEAACIQVLPQ
jgi:ferrous iron transport protein A